MPDGSRPPPSPQHPPAGDRERRGRSGSASEREGPSRRNRREMDERHHPEVSEERHPGDAQSPERENSKATRVTKCNVCHRLVGGGPVGMASHVQNSKLHAVWVNYNNGMSWTKAQAKANRDFDSWSAPAESRDKKPAQSVQAERPRRSRSRGRTDRHERPPRREVKPKSPPRGKDDKAGRGRSRSTGRAHLRKGITRMEEDIIIAQAAQIKKERQQEKEQNKLRSASPRRSKPKPKDSAPKPAKAKAAAIEERAPSGSYYSESDTETRAADKRLPAAEAIKMDEVLTRQTAWSRHVRLKAQARSRTERAGAEVAMEKVPNVGSWKLNKAELAELAARVKKGEGEAEVKRELQYKKAKANEDRKKAASAVAQKAQRQAAKPKAKAKANAATAGSAVVAVGAPGAASTDQDLNDATNKAYYCQVQEDVEVIRAEFGNDFRSEMPLAISSKGSSGVQEPYARSKALQALAAHGVYRASASVWWLNAMQSPTPGVPMSRRRVDDLTEYYYSAGAPRFHSERMIEVGVTRAECDCERPSNLQVISPEEVLHATLAGCATAVRLKDTLSDDEWQERKNKWKAVLLSIPVTFTEVSEKDIWKAAFNRRQGVLQDHESLSRTAMQHAMEMAHLKTLVEAQNPSAGKLSPQNLSTEFLRLGLSQVVGGTKQDEDDADGGSLAPTFVAWALQVHKTIMSQPRCVELLMDLESKFGTRSPFHKMSKLCVLANKPASAASRVWVLETLHDQMCCGDLKPTEITKSGLQGDRTHCGMIALFECKLRALDYMHSDLFPKAGVCDSDRRLLKEATANHAAYRAHSGDGDIAWQARLQKSGILCFELIQDIVFDKKFDNGVRQAAKIGGTPEQVWEQEPVKEAWEKVKVELAKEEEDRKARTAPVDEDMVGEAEDDDLTAVRKAPTSFALHSPGYWNAVANQIVRTYVNLAVEPATVQGVDRAISQCPAKEISGSQGTSSVLIWLDLDLLGESRGPGQQIQARNKKFNCDLNLLKKLLQGALMGRGSQKKGQTGAEEATKVVDGDIVLLHSGFESPNSRSLAKQAFRLSGSKKDELDSESREVLVVYEDESVRSRKQRHRGAYTSHTILSVFTSTCFNQCVPEKPYSESFTGTCVL
eukprot:Skav202425  [mRNA]  locus=scaffold1370:406666:410894:- [translate_table: standard]